MKRRWMSPSATPATWNEDECLQAPRLPRKKQRRPLGHVGTERATRASPVPYVPCLPRKVTIHVSKCHACMSKLYVCKLCMSKLRVSKLCVNKLCVSMSSTTPATWNEGGCHQVPRLSRETKMNVSKCHACHAKSRGDHSGTWEPSAPPELAQCHTCHACHAKWVSRVPRLPRETKVDVSSTTPATWNEGGCHQVPRLPRETKMNVSKCHACHAKSRGDHSGTWEPSAPPEPAQCHTCHACHVKRRWMSQSATPATQSAATCLQVPRLPRKCHACHCVWVSCVSVCKFCVSKLCVCVSSLWASCMWASCVCASYVWASCVWASCVWASCVWASCVWASCVWASCVWASCVWVSCAGGGTTGGREDGRDAESKTRTPHKDVGKNWHSIWHLFLDGCRHFSDIPDILSSRTIFQHIWRTFWHYLHVIGHTWHSDIWPSL